MEALSIEEVRHVQLGVLAEFDLMCRSHGLTYYLAYGTLLGAVRHGGYIPWDDDIDVMMHRQDYDRLPSVFEAAAPVHLSLGSPNTRAGWPFPFIKIGDDRTQLEEPLEDPLPLAVNIDVFPLDTLPSARLACRVQSSVLRLLRWAVEVRYLTVARGREWHHPLAIWLSKPLLRLVPVTTLVEAFTRVARVGLRSGDRVGVRVGSYDWSVLAGDVGTPIELRFEHLRLPGPAQPDAVLTAVYGDYRRLPPEAERTSEHAFVAHWRAID